MWPLHKSNDREDNKIEIGRCVQENLHVRLTSEMKVAVIIVIGHQMSIHKYKHTKRTENDDYYANRKRNRRKIGFVCQ